MPGIFTISLDFELHWGVFDKKERASRETVYRNTLALIPRMLELFAAYEVHVTWATVGSVMAQDQQEWEQWKPAVEPDYLEKKYSAYQWVQQNGLPALYNWAHFAPEAVRKILQYPGQELGTHTFSHYYCLEKQHEHGAFAADLEAAIQAAEKFHQLPVSLVFPRNQFNKNYLAICYAYGIKVVRSNPASWYWRPVNETDTQFFRKLVRTADAYIPMGPARTSYPLSAIQANPGEPLQLPASRFLRSGVSSFRPIDILKWRRLCSELRTAAKRNECYHLWWHPENFGSHPKENMKGLQILLQHYRQCKNKYGMLSWNMGEYAIAE
jgi:peptidoglycan/xylan/chitin deacetylase (PgdA/CDA1 family)